jgi:hypothetical protein
MVVTPAALSVITDPELTMIGFAPVPLLSLIV